MPKYILYLEPEETLRQNVKEYLTKTKKLFGATEAHQYIPHCSLTGFFETQQIEELQDLLDSLVRKLKPSDFSVEVEGIKKIEARNGARRASVSSATYPSVRISINVNPYIKEMIVNLTEKMENSVFLRVKPIDHISLAYLTKPHLANQSNGYNPGPYYDYALKHFSFNGSCKKWSIVLFEQIESLDLNEMHKFKEIQRWTYKNSSSQDSKPSL